MMSSMHNTHFICVFYEIHNFTVKPRHDEMALCVLVRRDVSAPDRSNIFWLCSPQAQSLVRGSECAHLCVKCGYKLQG